MIIIFGGAFNPPTIAHYEIAKKLISDFKPDKFIFVPVSGKYTRKEMAPFYMRYDMVEIIANKLGAYVSAIEDEGPYMGTYYILNSLKEIENDNDVYFVMGADNLDYLDDWIEAEKLVDEYKFIILPREGYDVNKKIEEKFNDHKDNFFVVDLKIDVSSTIFRNTHDKEILDCDVLEYIKEFKLYGVVDYD